MESGTKVGPSEEVVGRRLSSGSEIMIGSSSLDLNISRTIYYCIAGKLGGELNLAVWQSIFMNKNPPILYINFLTCIHVCTYGSLVHEFLHTCVTHC